MNIRTLSRHLVFALVPGAVSCGDAYGPKAPVPVATVELSATSLALGPAESKGLIAVTRAANGGALMGRAIEWTSSNPLVATVAPSGLVTGVAFGAATIRATVEGKAAEAAVTVTATQPAHIAGQWRMKSFDGKIVPAAYAMFYDQPLQDGRIVKVVEIRLDSAKLTLQSDGKYSFRRYCFTEWQDGVPAFKHCWGDHGQFALGNPPGRIAMVSDYIQNLSASGQVMPSGELTMVEPVWHGEAERATVWIKQ